MTVTRSHPRNTSQNLDITIALLGNPDCTQLRLFASPTTDTGAGRSTNLPILTALAIMDAPGGLQYVIHDGMFLTAARYPRYREVKFLLDRAEDHTKVWVGIERAPFTDDMAPADAASALMAIPVQNLTAATRKSFFGLLCSLTEAEYDKLYA